jgi:transposase-like protein
VGKAIKKLKLAHEGMSLGVLIHRRVRAAVEQAVHAELSAVLGAELYERSEARRGERNGSKTRRLTGPTRPLELTLPRRSSAARCTSCETSSVKCPSTRCSK